jgi:hypothetical protein
MDAIPNLTSGGRRGWIPHAPEIPADGNGAASCLAVVGRHRGFDETWVHSYVSEDHGKTYCLDDAPSAEAIGKAAGANRLPSTRPRR